MEFKDYYKILGLKKEASDSDIRKAYRKMVRKFHPDVSEEANAQDRIRDLNEANAVLGKKEKRQAYDELYDQAQNGHTQWQDNANQHRPKWNDGFSFDSNADPNHESDFSVFFSSLFGAHRNGGMYGHTGGPLKKRGEDQYVDIEISLQDMLKGSQRDIHLHAPATDAHNSPAQWQARTLRVTIPAGTRPGQSIRLNAQGMAGQNGGSNGGLYLNVRMMPDSLYEINGKDIYMKLPLTPTEAALGEKIQILLPDEGKLNVTIPANTANSSKLRIKGRGFPGQPLGDLYLNINVVLPPADTEAAKHAYRALADAAPLNPRNF